MEQNRRKTERWEAVVWVNEEGSMTTHRPTQLDALKAVEEMKAEALRREWVVRSTEVNRVG